MSTIDSPYLSKTSVVLIVVLVAGYSLYGGLFVAAGVVQESLAGDSAIPGGSGTGPPGEGTDPVVETLDFETVDAGLNYSYRDVEIKDYERVLTNAGVYAADYDGDGWGDVLALGGSEPVLFENAGGSFEASGALPDLDRRVTAAVWVDYDVDGSPDLVMLSEDHAPLLLENTGEGFETRPGVFEMNLSVPSGATVGDYDRDGCPDLFVHQNGDWGERLPTGFRNYSAPVNGDNGNPDYLYHGTCEGFERVEDAGLEGARWTLAASFVDLNGDGYPDIHQANDINHDVVYVNLGNGSFEQVVLYERTNRNGMSSEVADVTWDGRPDIFVTNIYYPQWAAEKINKETSLKARGNNLVSARPGGRFVGAAENYEVTRGGWGWAAVLTDFDNDGDQDLFHTTREVTFDGRDLRFSEEEQEKLDSKQFYSYPAVWERSSPNSFTQVLAKESGFEEHNGRGVTRLDYDRDGDQDLIVATTAGFRVYDNRMEQRSAVQVRVLDESGSVTGAYGATVTVTTTDGEQTRRVHARTDYLSQDSRIVHVGVGNATRVDVRVVWPDGTERTFENVRTDRRLVVTPAGIERTIKLDG